MKNVAGMDAGLIKKSGIDENNFAEIKAALMKRMLMKLMRN